MDRSVDYASLIVPAKLFSSTTGADRSVEGDERYMKRILDGNAVPYTVHYIDIDESASEELANAKRGREKDSLPLLAAGASMLLDKQDLEEMNDESGTRPIKAAISGLSAARYIGLPDGHEFGHGRNALHHLVSTGGEITVLDRLLGMGVDVDAKDVNGDTPLHLAVFAGRKDVVDALLAFQARRDLKNKHGKTPVDEAAALAAQSPPAREIAAALGAQQ